MIKSKFIFTVTLLMFFSGCATYNFFGLQVEQLFRAEKIILKEADKEKVIYLYSPREMNSNIFATGKKDKREYSVTIYNTAKLPLATNYETDKFFITTTQNERIYLKAEPYRLVDHIPSNEKLTISLKLPAHLKTVKYKEIKNLVCELGPYSYQTIIVLKNTKY